MLNQCILVGRIKELHEGNIVIAVPRAYKNEEGAYDTDMIKVAIEGKVNESVNEFCNKDDIVGIKGRIEALDDNMIIKAEKVTFLSSRTNRDDNEEEQTENEEE